MSRRGRGGVSQNLIRIAALVFIAILILSLLAQTCAPVSTTVGT